MNEVRMARNKFEVDFFPPYGKSEVILTGEIATYAGLIFATALVLKYFE
ncbi:MAG: hypothetical protein KAR87_01465 [Candidatus Aenigmarchaeota archaeon]|nr:hypothetical protein [Candidatus Aenigmarchaeota archaeon]